MSKDNLLTIQVTKDIEITTQEFVRRVAAFVEMPKFSIGQVVEFIGEYKQTRPCVIVEVSYRANGWHYAGVCLTTNGAVRVSFSENSVTKCFEVSYAE